MAQRGQWILVVVIVSVLGGAILLGTTLSPALGPISVGSRAPDFDAFSLETKDSVDFATYRGNVVLLNIWATWCIPCEAEMPSIQRLYEDLHPLGLEVVAVSVDNAGPDVVQEWADERGLTFDILHDQSGRIERLYQAIGVPETFIIDREGVIVKKVIGPAEWDHPTQTTLLRTLLGETRE